MGLSENTRLWADGYDAGMTVVKAMYRTLGPPPLNPRRRAMDTLIELLGAEQPSEIRLDAAEMILGWEGIE